MKISQNNKKIIAVAVFFVLFIGLAKGLKAQTAPVDLPSWWAPGTGVTPINSSAPAQSVNTGQYGIPSTDGATGAYGSGNAPAPGDSLYNYPSSYPSSGGAGGSTGAGASSVSANGSNTGAKTIAATPSSTQNAGSCVAGAMLAKLLSSSISSALGLGTKAVTGATTIAERTTSVPVTIAGTQAARNQEAVTNAHTGSFSLFGIQTGVSWDDVGYCIVNTIIDYIVNSTIAWANSGFKGNPAFVRNPQQFFKQLADREASTFIQELAYDTTGLNICKPFRVVIATGLAGSYAKLNGKYQNSCSLSQLQQNLMTSGKYTITTPTDWLALTQPQNNAYYSYISAGDELSKRIAIKNNVARFDLTIDRGFLSKTKCKDDTKPESPTNPCDKTTPGSVIADSLSQTLNIPKNRLVSAQKFDQMVDAIVNNLIKIALGDVLTKVTGQAPSAPTASDYYTQVANNVTSASSATNGQAGGSGGPSGTNGTASGAMLDQIRNGATFNNPDWNAYALDQIKSSGLLDLPIPKDASTYFPDGVPTAEGYLSIMAAIAQRESGGQAAPARYLETKIGDGTTYSVGLMSLTPGDLGTGNMTYSDLENPYNNIKVAVGIMDNLIKTDGVISGPPDPNRPSARAAGTGMSAYWSTFK